MSKKTLSIVLLLLVVGLTAIFIFGKTNQFSKIFNTPLPSAVPYNESSNTVTPKPKPAVSPIISTKEINLDIPFTSQAPNLNWDQPYQDFCEEASVLMAVQYVRGELIPSADFANDKMLAIMDFEIKRFGYHIDTSVDEVAIIFREFYGIKAVKLIHDPTIEDIKKALTEKKAVVVPAAGRQLYNPYFTPPGPLYHMLVIKGFTKDGKFITNDPGTRRGADFIYKPDVLMNAIHDWNGGDVENGAKVIMVIG
ncbi:MAG: C39 family peptidase [Candidatus Berkelbacteria bacterium]|nr:C39 family peptidase [Candidatus Berkelbacteria bacterium]